jgi:C_GCAxxG_C_C family probable redox protein
MSERTEEAVATFKEGYNCAQAAFSAFAVELGMSREQAMKVAIGFGGGMARQGDTCGAVTGAMMALGLAHGSAEADEAAKQRVYASIWQFLAEFRARHGSTLCRDLLECDLGTEEGRKRAHDTGVTKARCPGFVGSAVEIVEKMV